MFKLFAIGTLFLSCVFVLEAQKVGINTDGSSPESGVILALLTKAIQEQQQMIEAQKQELELVKKELQELKRLK
jgi:hypothetical protein